MEQGVNFTWREGSIYRGFSIKNIWWRQSSANRHSRGTRKGQQDLINLEREYITGTPHERDSIRTWIRKVEHNLEVEKTFTYFAPTEP